MKVILEFDLPAEENEYYLATKSRDMSIFITDLSEKIRSYLKYGNNFKTSYEALEAIRSDFFRLLEENDINIDKLYG
jgi:hypothetical protein